jgi:DNA modification methylase
MIAPYYQDDLVTLYHGDCREAREWLAADVLVTDPPYGIKYAGGGYKNSPPRTAIAGDGDVDIRDTALSMWGDARPAVVFGSAVKSPPPGTRQALVWRKHGSTGFMGAMAGWRRDFEMVYLVGPWKTAPATRSGIVGPSRRPANHERRGHSHAKPVELLVQLLGHCPPGVIADPFAGSGSTLLAARQLGRQTIGVEIEERYCELVAERLAQDSLPFEAA